MCGRRAGRGRAAWLAAALPALRGPGAASVQFIARRRAALQLAARGLTAALLLAASLAGAAPAAGQTPAPASPGPGSDPIRSELEALGYEVRDVSEQQPSPWEVETFSTLAPVTVYQVRRRQPLPGGGGNYYPRFRILVEAYAGAEPAAARLARLREIPPGLGGEPLKLFPLRDGFRLDSLVYVVTTDAVLFEGELERLTAQLEQRLGQAP